MWNESGINRNESDIKMRYHTLHQSRDNTNGLLKDSVEKILFL